MKLLLLPNYTKPKTAYAVCRILTWAQNRSVTVIMEESCSQELAMDQRKVVSWIPHLSPNALASCDAILTVGGDGTVIHAAHIAAGLMLPLVGINTGTLGFLAQVSLDNLEERLEQLYARRYTVEQRAALQAKWPGGEAPFALNDIVLQRQKLGGLADLNAYHGKELVGRYRADGLVFSTATGSTAYAYATGGPIVDPNLDAIVVSPICPQNRMNIPLICGMDQSISVMAINSPMRVLVDGTDLGTLSAGRKIQVRRSIQIANMVQFEASWGVLEWQRRISLL